MAKRKAKYTKPNKTAAEKMFENLPKPVAPVGGAMTNPRKKRVKKFDVVHELSHYKEST